MRFFEILFLLIGSFVLSSEALWRSGGGRPSYPHAYGFNTYHPEIGFQTHIHSTIFSWLGRK